MQCEYTCSEFHQGWLRHAPLTEKGKAATAYTMAGSYVSTRYHIELGISFEQLDEKETIHSSPTLQSTLFCIAWRVSRFAKYLGKTKHSEATYTFLEQDTRGRRKHSRIQLWERSLGGRTLIKLGSCFIILTRTFWIFWGFPSHSWSLKTEAPRLIVLQLMYRAVKSLHPWGTVEYLTNWTVNQSVHRSK